MFPFRYARGRCRRNYMSFFAGVALRNGLSLLMARKERLNGFSDADLSTFLTTCLDHPVSHWLEQNGYLPLSRSRKQRMSQQVELEVREYGDRQKKISVMVRFARSNHCPALGIDVWIANRLTLFGGVVHIVTPGRRGTVQLSNQIRSFLSLPLLQLTSLGQRGSESLRK
jgi:hypothetical protein